MTTIEFVGAGESLCRRVGRRVCGNPDPRIRTRGTRIALLLVVVGAALGAVVAGAQTPPPAGGQEGCTAAQKSDPATAKTCAAPAPPAAGSPFPGEDADIPVGPGAKPASAVPDAPAAKNAADAHPFPGDADAPQPSSPAAKAAAGAHPYPGDPDAPKDAPADGFSSSSSSSGGSSSGDDASGDAGPLKDAGSSGDDTKSAKGKRRKLPKLEAQTPEARESEDIDVAQFYMSTGNTVGAYARAKDAVSIMPDDPFAQFALGEAARKSGKIDEARAAYAKVLTLDPNDKQIRETKRALAELGTTAAK